MHSVVSQLGNNVSGREESLGKSKERGSFRSMGTEVTKVDTRKLEN